MAEKMIDPSSQRLHCKRIELVHQPGSSTIIVDHLVMSINKEGYIVYNITAKDNKDLLFKANSMKNAEYDEYDCIEATFNFKESEITHKNPSLFYYPKLQIYQVVVKDES